MDLRNQLLRGDLSDAAVFAGAKGSASRSIFERIADNIGLADDDYRYVTDPSEVADLVVVFAPIAPERIAEFPELRVDLNGNTARNR